MDAILAFFSDLILFTAGLAVAIFWILAIVIIVDEVLDLVIESRNKNDESEEDER